MKKSLSAIIVALLFCSCTKFECPGFDDNSYIAEYNLFKGNLEEYIFLNPDSITTNLTRTFYDRSQYEEKKCNHCMCYPEQNSTYNLQGFALDISNTLSHGWREENIASSGEISISFNQTTYNFITNGLFLEEEGVEFSQSTFDSVKINFKTFTFVTYFELQDTLNSNLKAFWFNKSNGLIGLKVGNQIFEKK